MTAKKEREDKSPSDKLAVNDPAGRSPSGLNQTHLLMLDQQQFIDPSTGDFISPSQYVRMISQQTPVPDSSTIAAGTSRLPINAVEDQIDNSRPPFGITRDQVPNTELVPLPPSLNYTYNEMPATWPPYGTFYENIQSQNPFAVQDPYHYSLLYPPTVNYGAEVQSMQSILPQSAGSEEVNSNQVPATDDNTAMSVNDVRVIEEVQSKEQNDVFSQTPLVQGGLPTGQSNVQDSSTKPQVPDTAAPRRGQSLTLTTNVVTGSGSPAQNLMLGLELHFSISESEALELSDIRIRPGSGSGSIANEHPSSHGTGRDFTLQVQLRPGNGISTEARRTFQGLEPSQLQHEPGSGIISSRAPEHTSFHGTGREFTLQLDLRLRPENGNRSNDPNTSDAALDNNEQ